LSDQLRAAAPITFLIYSPYPRYSGGRENWLYNLTGELARRGRSATVLSYASNRTRFYPPADGVRVVSLPSVRYLDRAFFWVNRLTLGLARLVDALVIYPLIAARRLAREKPEVLVCMNSIPEGLAARIAGRPFFVSVRGDVPAEMARPRWALERPLRAIEHRTLVRSVRVLANGSDTQERLRREGIESAVVPNGVDLGRFRARPAENGIGARLLEAARGRPVISAIGTLRPIKGTGDAIACAEELKKSGAGFVLVLVGKGDEGRYRRLARVHGVDDVVVFLGETADVPAVLRHTDIFLALSRGSGLSMAALEAMAAGVPVVALDSPVYRQLIDHEVNGLLARSPAELAACCLRLLRDADLRRRLGEEAGRTAEGYDWDRVATRLLRELGR